VIIALSKIKIKVIREKKVISKSKKKYLDEKYYLDYPNMNIYIKK
jgi:hypothetical protein